MTVTLTVKLGLEEARTLLGELLAASQQACSDERRDAEMVIDRVIETLVPLVDDSAEQALERAECPGCGMIACNGGCHTLADPAYDVPQTNYELDLNDFCDDLGISDTEVCVRCGTYFSYKGGDQMCYRCRKL